MSALRRDILGGGAQEWPSVETLPNAVVALIDISGYTQITSTLTRLDSAVAGARVREIINPPFVLIIEAVHKWGTFSACAEHDSNLALEILRATACCVDLLAVMKGYQVQSGPGDGGLSAFQLKIHVGIGIGPLHRVHVGESTVDDPHLGTGERRPLPRREFFVAGQAVVNAGEMEGAAGRGQVAIAPAASSALREMLGEDYSLIAQAADGPIVISEEYDLHRVTGTLQAAYAARNGSWEESSRGNESVLAEQPKFMSRDYVRALTYVDESLALYLMNAPGNAHGSTHATRTGLHSEAVERNETVEVRSGVNQLRNVSIVFIRFTELSVAKMNEPKSLQLTQTIFMIIISVLRRFNGCLRQFACDDKAASALVVFGLPGFAHERGEEVPAMRTAWEIRAKLLKVIGTKFGVGVTSGVVLYGIVGNENRSDGTCLGAPVNLAARFMTNELSAGRILCEEGMRTKCQEAFEFEGLGQVLLKGFLPMNVYAPTTPTKRTDESREVEAMEIFGRDMEMEMVKSAVIRWSRGEPVLLGILGRSGAGKSTMANWMKSYLEVTLGDRMILGETYGIDMMQNSPFSGLARFLLSLQHAFRNVKEGVTSLQASQGMVDYISTTKLSRTSTVSSVSDVTSIFRILGLSKQLKDMFYKVMPALRRANEDSGESSNEAIPQEVTKIVALALVRGLNSLGTYSNYQLVILADDLQWMDATSLEVLHDIMAKCPRILMIVLSRPPEEVNSSTRVSFDRLVNSLHAVKIELAPLDKESSGKLIKQAMKDAIKSGFEFPDNFYDNIFALAQVTRKIKGFSYYEALTKLDAGVQRSMMDEVLLNYHLSNLHIQAGENEIAMNICRKTFSFVGLDHPKANRPLQTLNLIIRLFRFTFKAMSLTTKVERQKAELEFAARLLPRLIPEYNLQCVRARGGKVGEAANYDGLHQLLLILRNMIMNACYVSVQLDNEVDTAIVVFIRAIMTMITSEDDILDIAISAAVLPLINLSYFDFPLLCRALRRRTPEITMTLDELLSIRGPSQIVVNEYLFFQCLWIAFFVKPAEYRKIAMACVLSDSELHAALTEKARADRSYALMTLYFLGEFRELQRLLLEVIANYGEEDVGVTANSDNIIQLCAAMIQ
ncbi:hypothetical protein HK101_004455, partial [Irineochytrium annulatum]